MEAKQIKKFWVRFKFHAKVVWRGFYRTLYGAAIAALMAMAIFGFCTVTRETGWAAVCDFIASCATAVVAMSCMYLLGCPKKGGKHG